jgi:hypothetical protein
MTSTRSYCQNPILHRPLLKSSNGFSFFFWNQNIDVDFNVLQIDESSANEAVKLDGLSHQEMTIGAGSGRDEMTIPYMLFHYVVLCCGNLYPLVVNKLHAWVSDINCQWHQTFVSDNSITPQHEPQFEHWSSIIYFELGFCCSGCLTVWQGTRGHSESSAIGQHY